MFWKIKKAVGALMMALQKSLMEQSDIVPVLQGFEFKVDNKEELYIMNPPILKFEEEPSILDRVITE